MDLNTKIVLNSIKQLKADNKRQYKMKLLNPNKIFARGENRKVMEFLLNKEGNLVVIFRVAEVVTNPKFGWEHSRGGKRSENHG